MAAERESSGRQCADPGLDPLDQRRRAPERRCRGGDEQRVVGAAMPDARDGCLQAAAALPVEVAEPLSVVQSSPSVACPHPP